MTDNVFDFNYAGERKENIACNLCGGSSLSILARRSKSGLSVETKMCRRCGLIFISPRMTRAGYDRYYKFYYRLDRNVVKGTTVETDLERNFRAAVRFGRALARRFGNLFGKGLTVDIGSSTGGVLAGLREVMPELKVFGIEPSAAESGYANAHNVPTKTILFEDFKEDLPEPPGNIFCVQSLNHLLDPLGFVEWSYRMLGGGALVLVVKNFRHQARRGGSLEAAVQIDHVYMFTPETLRLLVESAGFEIIALEVDEGRSESALRADRAEGMSRHHIRLVARKPEVSAAAGPVRNPPPRISDGAGKRERVPKLSRFSWWKLRLSLYPPLVKLVYLLKYSRRLSRLRRALGIV